MNDVNLVRLMIGIACVVLILAIYFIGKPRKPDQGRRLDGRRSGGSRSRDGERSEPTLGDTLEQELRDNHGGDPAEQTELDLLERNLAADAHADGRIAPGSLRPSLVGGTHPAQHSAQSSQPMLGIRTEERFDRIVTLYVAARQGQHLNGSDLIVAAEKAGLVHGHMSIFHRMVDGRPEQGPVFSVANMVKPGSFDLTRVQELRTPGISFFMTLPVPMPALDAWDAMLPTAQRMAELLDALVLDEEHNALGRQRIAHIRDELRAYDRQREQQTIRPGR
ncbi:MAG: cell division protein ZipA [Lysobacteraceae bacterium]